MTDEEHARAVAEAEKKLNGALDAAASAGLHASVSIAERALSGRGEPILVVDAAVYRRIRP